MNGHGHGPEHLPEMTPAAVDAMERRLLEAFAAHHEARAADGSHALVMRVARQRWFAAAAAAIVIGGGVAAWRATRGAPSVPQKATGASTVSRAIAQKTPDPHPVRLATDDVNMQTSVTAPGARPARRIAMPPQRPRAHEAPQFVPIPGAAGLPDFESGTIVRMALQIASLPVYGVDISSATADGPVEADVLVGQDGQARAIRLVTTDSISAPRSRQ